MRLLRFIGYALLFVVSFCCFLYWTFPYDVLKDQLVTQVQNIMGNGIDVSVGTLEPYYFSGAEVRNLELATRDASGSKPLLKIDKAHGRLSLFGLLFGRPKLVFGLTAGKGKMSGSGRRTEDAIDVDLGLDSVDLGMLKFFESRWGLKVKSRIDGDVNFSFDRKRPVRSAGKGDLLFQELSLAPSTLTIAGSSVELPAITLAKGKGAELKLEAGKGAVVVDTFAFSGGDLSLDLKGKIFLSNDLENTRLNLSGSFAVSDALAQALPFLFIVDKQKGSDGRYPLSVTGRLASPSIRVGTFTLPL